MMEKHIFGFTLYDVKCDESCVKQGSCVRGGNKDTDVEDFVPKLFIKNNAYGTREICSVFCFSFEEI